MNNAYEVVAALTLEARLEWEKKLKELCSGEVTPEKVKAAMDAYREQEDLREVRQAAAYFQKYGGAP